MSGRVFPLTETLARWVAVAEMPDEVMQESARAFLNWTGCALGGSAAEVTRRAAGMLATPGGEAMLLGTDLRAHLADAAFVNCVASSALSYDDTHLATVTHPTGPVAAALMAWAGTVPVSGPDFLAALALGIEVQCRLSTLLLMPPAEPNLALYITGITGPVGAAAALARLMGLDARGIGWAMGHAATQAAGFRATHGSMAGLIVPGHAARAGVLAARMAQAGIDCSPDTLESPRGFVGIFSRNADPEGAVSGLGKVFEMLRTSYKPYPAGIVVHAVIDACLDLAAQGVRPEEIAGIDLTVPPLSQTLADRPHPASPFEATVSLQHWAAHALQHGSAGVEALAPSHLTDPQLVRLRGRMRVTSDPALDRDAATVTLALVEGRQMRAHVPHATGSLSRPMTDAALNRKFLDQAAPVLGPDRAGTLRAILCDLTRQTDTGAALRPLLTPPECDAPRHRARA